MGKFTYKITARCTTRKETTKELLWDVYSFADVAMQMTQGYMLLCSVECYSRGASFVTNLSTSAADNTCIGNRNEEVLCPKRQAQAEPNAH